jgi:UDP-GlcNAc:undecaprenyl-phosphate GlcNAc-1-phosphate transferase
LAISLKLVDHPGGRKRHIGKVPIIGGVCMFFGFAAGAMVAIPTAQTAFLIAGGFFLLLIGVVDDRYDLPASIRFGTQIAAVLLMVYGGGIEVYSLGDPLATGEIPVGAFSLIFTMLISVALINALNMTDGMDGLAGSLALIALCGLAAVGFGTWVTDIAVIGASVVLGFLCFNFPIAANRSVRTFMGDAGSTFLGFLIAWLSIGSTQAPVSAVSPVVALCLVAIPFYDLTSCFFRRILAGRSPFSADRNHFHHVLQEARLRRRQVLMVMIVAAALPAVGGLVLSWSGAPDSVVFVLWLMYGVCLDTGFRTFRRIRRAETLTTL